MHTQILRIRSIIFSEGPKKKSGTSGGKVLFEVVFLTSVEVEEELGLGCGVDQAALELRGCRSTASTLITTHIVYAALQHALQNSIIRICIFKITHITNKA